jgi:hypothetical protein
VLINFVQSTPMVGNQLSTVANERHMMVAAAVVVDPAFEFVKLQQAIRRLCARTVVKGGHLMPGTRWSFSFFEYWAVYVRSENDAVKQRQVFCVLLIYYDMVSTQLL